MSIDKSTAVDKYDEVLNAIETVQTFCEDQNIKDVVPLLDDVYREILDEYHRTLAEVSE